jgi:hypothetical protein
MSFSAEQFETYSRIFIQRPDAFAQQSPRGSYYLRRHPVTPEVVRAHLEGRITAGWYAPDPQNLTRWVCLDADRPDGLAQLQEAWTQLDRRGISAELERSRRGGHLWVLFEPMRARIARRLVLGALPDLMGIEVFPKQDEIAAGGYGSLVRGPQGVHRLTGEWYPFVDPISLAPVCTTVPGTLDYLATRPRLGAADVAEHLAILLEEAKRRATVPPRFSRPGAVMAGRRSAREVKDRIGDLRSFIGQFVELDAAGRGPCPFHPPDRNASFSVHPSGYWVCFHEVNPRTGRYLGGDAITFYMRLRGVSFTQALADLDGVVTPDGSTDNGQPTTT